MRMRMRMERKEEWREVEGGVVCATRLARLRGHSSGHGGVTGQEIRGSGEAEEASARN